MPVDSIQTQVLNPSSRTSLYSNEPTSSFKAVLGAHLPPSEVGSYDPYEQWPIGTEIWPPYEQKMMFFMVFPPGFPSDLKDKLKALYSDPTTDKQQFASMYDGTFMPYEMMIGDTSGMKPHWTASWRTTLAQTLKASAGYVGQLAPEYQAAARARHRLAASLLEGASSGLAQRPASEPSMPEVDASLHQALSEAVERWALGPKDRFAESLTARDFWKTTHERGQTKGSPIELFSPFHPS